MRYVPFSSGSSRGSSGLLEGSSGVGLKFSPSLVTLRLARPIAAIILIKATFVNVGIVH